MRTVLVEKYKFPDYISEYGVEIWTDRITGRLEDGGPGKIHVGCNMAEYYKGGRHIVSKNISSHEEQIEEIIREFDFHKVQKTMKLLEWGYFNTSTPPSLMELELTARRLLTGLPEDAEKFNYDTPYTATGGFHAEYNRITNSFDLKFVVTDWSTFYL